MIWIVLVNEVKKINYENRNCKYQKQSKNFFSILVTKKEKFRFKLLKKKNFVLSYT